MATPSEKIEIAILDPKISENRDFTLKMRVENRFLDPKISENQKMEISSHV